MKKKIFISLIIIIIVTLIGASAVIIHESNLKKQEIQKEKDEVAKTIEKLEKAISLQVYVKNVNNEELLQLKEKIKKIERVTKVEFVSKEDALREMKDKYSDQLSELLENYEGENNIFPDSYVVYCQMDGINKRYYKEVKEKILELPNVESVVSNEEIWLTYYNEGKLDEALEKIGEMK